MAGRRRYLVAYDVRDAKRLRRVHTAVQAFGWAMQYSVFICDLDPLELVELRLELRDHLDHGADTVAIVDLGLPEERGRRCFEFLGVAPALPRSGPLIL